MKRSFMKKLCSVTLTLAMVMSLFTGLSFGAETTTYDAPTTPMSVDDNIITGTAHRSGSPALGFMGINAKSGFGMINGGVVSDLADAITRPALGVWGTSINDNPDPYYWNYFYNFYAEKNGLEKSNDALLNADLANNPVQADATLVEEYGNVSASLYTRPDLAFGCASTGANTDTDGYAEQIATINSFTPDSEYYQEGDEDYDPECVGIKNASISQHIASLHDLADAMDRVTAKTGKVGRYGNPQVIVQNYEKYIYGVSAYIMSKIASGEVAKKTVAIINAVNEDGTYVLCDKNTQQSRAPDRIVEYAKLITDNLADSCATATEDGTAKIATAEEVAAADVVITCYVNNSEGARDAIPSTLEAQATYNPNMTVISNYPNTLFGITMNSFENCMGFGYFDSYMYSDVLNLNPVEFCTLFYQYFCHVSDMSSLKKMVAANFADVTLPDGIANTLSDIYDQFAIEAKIAEGLEYLENYRDAFAESFVPTSYEVDWATGLAADLGKLKQAQTVKVSGLSKTYKVSDLKDKAKTFTVKATAETKVTFSKVSGSKQLSISKTGKVTVKKGTKDGTYKMTIKAKAAASDTYKAASVKKTVKVVVKKNQSVKVTGLSKTVKASALKSKAVSFKLGAEKAKGDVTFSKKSGSAKLSISKAGKVTVKKGTKKGKYEMKIKVNAAETSKYAAVSGTATVKVTVK